MSVAAGTRFGPYEMIAPIGAGGMGEVWKARDTRLDRTVAVKFLPADFAQNAQLKLRFEREARTISHLSHPNICTLFDVGENFIVMELLDGESLAERIARGPLPVHDVLRYGVQIAEALGKAHREGIVHRDLKPGNIMMTKSGAKLLDFGLAKTTKVAALPEGVTAQKPLTTEGTIVGTFQYMAPEQLAGDEPDARTDIFALGAVLYEMATGRRAFDGKTKTSVIAAIVSGEPAPMHDVQPLTPPALEHVVKKCLAKDPDDRWQSATDIAAELHWISEAGSQAGVAAPFAVRRRTRERLAWSLAAAFALLTIVAGAMAWREVSRTPELMRFAITLPSNTDTFRFDSGGLALSPDGLHLVMSLRTLNGGRSSRQLWVRSLRSMEAVPLPDTIGASYPFWSPDGKSIAFFAGGKLKRIPAEGGPVEVICDAPAGRGGSWNANGTIIFTPDIYAAIASVPASGGTPRQLTTLDRTHDVVHRWSVFLPDGRHFLYVRVTRDGKGDEHSSLMAASLDSPVATRIADDVSNAAYVPPGWLIFGRGESLMALRFDARSLRATGEPVVMAIGKVGNYPDRTLSYFAASANGTLVYLPPNRQLTQMRWVDREGRASAAEEQPGYYIGAAISADGKRLAFSRTDDGTLEHSDIWLHEIGTATTSRFTFDGGHGIVHWTPDGKRLYYTTKSKNGVDVYDRPIAGSGKPEPVAVSPRFKETFDVSPDGKWVIDGEQFPDTNVDLMLVSVADHTATPFLRTPGSEWMPAFSPDGHWIAFQASDQINVRRFPDTGEQWQVSTNGGGFPMWSRDGKAIFYTGSDGTISMVNVRPGESFDFDPPARLFPVDLTTMPEGLSSPLVGISRDAQRFLVVTKTDTRETPFQVVLNWPQMMAAK